MNQRVPVLPNPFGSTNQAVTKVSLPIIHKCLLAHFDPPFYAPTTTLLAIGSNWPSETRKRRTRPTIRSQCLSEKIA